MRSVKPRSRLLPSPAIVIASAVALVSVAALLDVDLLRYGHSALRKGRTAATWLAGPAVRRWLAGSGQMATAILLFDPVGLAEDADGNLYVADRGDGKSTGVPVGRFIWRIAPDNTATIIAGTGSKGMPADGQQALEADLGGPTGLAMDSQERVYFADPFNHVVMRIEADGRLSRVAGTGQPGYGGDGGAADLALLNQPYDVDLDSTDNLYIADHSNHRVRMVTPGGVITTVAGNGIAGYDGDHGPAAKAALNGVYGVHVHPDGRLLIADTNNHVIRQVGGDGTISTLAGTGEAGNGGDGGPADQAQLNGPESVSVGGSGHLYIGDEANHNIRVIAPGGIIATLMGDGAPGFAKIGQPADEAPLNDPEFLLERADGSLVISDGDTGRLLTFDPDGNVALVAGPAERSIEEAMRLLRPKDPQVRAAYERRLRAAGLKD